MNGGEFHKIKKHDKSLTEINLKKIEFFGHGCMRYLYIAVKSIITFGRDKLLCEKKP